MINLFDFDYEKMLHWVREVGQSDFRAKQLIQWIHQRRVTSFDEMHTLPKSFREYLNDHATLELMPIITEKVSQDGTVKWLLKVDGINAIETVYIPETGRGTLCISSQVGCALDCDFCSTGKQGFNRNLSCAEIIGQLWIAIGRLRELYTDIERPITNVVMMGMGEPLANEKHVFTALSLMLDPLSYGLAYRRVTVSTSGLVPAIERLRDKLPVALAISLHAPTNELRDILVPINKKYPIEQLMAICADYFKHHKRQVIYEYVMLKDVNDSDDMARKLKKLLRQAPGKINLIPFNPFPGTSYETSTPERIELSGNPTQ